MTNITVAAEILRDEVALFSVEQLRYVNGKLEVPVGWWAWKRLREIATQDAMEKTGTSPNSQSVQCRFFGSPECHSNIPCVDASCDCIHK
jgi:hypothetical protein